MIDEINSLASKLYKISNECEEWTGLMDYMEWEIGTIRRIYNEDKKRFDENKELIKYSLKNFKIALKEIEEKKDNVSLDFENKYKENVLFPKFSANEKILLDLFSGKINASKAISNLEKFIKNNRFKHSYKWLVDDMKKTLTRIKNIHLSKNNIKTYIDMSLELENVLSMQKELIGEKAVKPKSNNIVADLFDGTYNSGTSYNSVKTEEVNYFPY